jgi:hypothetical protein
LLRVDPERRFSTPPSKAGLGAAEWVNHPSQEEVVGGYSSVYEIQFLLLHLVNEFVIMYHFSLLKNEFQKPKKLKESP